MEYSGAGGKLIHDKNQKQKISWHCPFNTQRDFSENKTGQYTLLCSIFSKTVTVKSYTIWRYCPFKRDDYIKYNSITGLKKDTIVNLRAGGCGFSWRITG